MKNKSVKNVKTDCFAYTLRANGTPKCTALVKMYCKIGECSFFATEEQALAARLKAEQRLGLKG